MARTNLFHQLKKRQQRRNKRAADAQRLSLENLEERLAMTANSAGLDDAALDAEFDANSLLLKFTDEIQQISSTVADALVDSGTIGMSAVFSDYEIIFGEHTHDELLADSKTYLDAAQDIGLDRWFEIELPESTDLDSLVEVLLADSSVSHVEKNYFYRADNTSEGVTEVDVGAASISSTSDQGSGEVADGETSVIAGADAWHLDEINVEEAWDHLESMGHEAGGSSDIVVAVIDTGVDYTHPDLAANMWVNTQEIAGNGIDDDGNGLVDDIHGGSFVSDVRFHSGDPMDDNAHGTHVAGIIASAANEYGTVGVAYNAKIMALKALQYSGIGNAADIAEAIYYAVENGADILNMSFGSYSPSEVIKDALEVAYGQCVLVAAAGNDGLHNEVGKLGNKPMYPAAFEWVVGVHATQKNPTFMTGWRAPFSNWDLEHGSRNEYEVAAPGSNVRSLLPNGGYANWNGTSMAAPVVSGIAALLRTAYPDKQDYNSRFVMGQLLVGGVNESGGGFISQDEIVDAHRILTETPQPELAYTSHLMFDGAEISQQNNDDGTVNAGETLDLALSIRNRWGKASNVSVTVEAYAPGAGLPDPYVTVDVPTISYGDAGAFGVIDNGLKHDESGLIVGAENPFKISFSKDTPNNHIAWFRLKITAKNGLDEGDHNLYTFTDYFSVEVMNAVELPTVISEDMVLTSDHHWLVTGPVLIPENVTVTVEPGAIITWGNVEKEGPYQSPRGESHIQLEGKLIATGSQEEKISFVADRHKEHLAGVRFKVMQNGSLNIDHAEIHNPFIFGWSGVISRSKFTGDDIRGHMGWRVEVARVEDSIVDIPNVFLVGDRIKTDFDRVLFKQFGAGHANFRNISDSVILPGAVTTVRMDNMSYGGPAEMENLVILNPNLATSPDPRHHIGLYGHIHRGTTYNPGTIYVGSTDPQVLDLLIKDVNDNFNLGELDYSSFLETAPESAYPFVVDVEVSGAEGATNKIGVGATQFTVRFNRDMDTSQHPVATFGPAEPYTDYALIPVDDGWVDSRTWVGEFEITEKTGGGMQHLRISGAAAANKPWLVVDDNIGTAYQTAGGIEFLGSNYSRFNFDIVTNSIEAMAIQASGGEGKIDLSWAQDDYELVAGYNLYRSSTMAGNYSRLNSTIIPGASPSFTDNAVEPGENYFYKFKVVQTNGTESDESPVASAAPLDTVPAVISHTPTNTASPNFDLTIRAEVTDNVRVEAVDLHYRAIGETDFNVVQMTFTTGNRYSATLDAAVMTAPGVEYFIAASDGVSTVYSGFEASPHVITVVDKPMITGVTPAVGTTAGGERITIVGSNFKDGASVSIGGMPASNVVVVNSNQISVTTPAHFAARADITVTNPDGEQGVLLGAYTYISEGVVVSMPSASAYTGQMIEIPVMLSNTEGMLSAELTLNYDSNVLTAKSVRVGALANGWVLQGNTNTSGEVVITGAGVTPVSASGVLGYVLFEVVGDNGEQSALTVTRASLNDGAIETELAAGNFSVNVASAVGGRVTYWSGGKQVSGSEFTLTNSTSGTIKATSGSDGRFTFGNLPRDAYSLEVTKDGDVNGISAYDASMVLRSVAGLTSLTAAQRIAADVDCSGEVTALDAAYILQKAVGLIPGHFPGAGKDWAFTPAERSYTDLTSSRTSENFTAVLLGDVSGNWSPEVVEDNTFGAASTGGVLEQNAPVNSNAVLTLGSRGAQAGTTVSLPLTLQSGGVDAYSLDAVINYDPSTVSIEASDVTSTVNDGSMIVLANIIRPGVLRVAVASTQPIPNGEVFATLNFTATSLQGTTPIAIGMASVDESRIHTETISGKLASLTPIEEDGEVTLSEDTDGQLYADSTPITVNDAPMGPSLNRWALYGVDRVDGENVALLKDHTGGLLKAKAGPRWDFRNIFYALSNMDTRTLSRESRGAAFALFSDLMLEEESDNNKKDDNQLLFAVDPGQVQE